MSFDGSSVAAAAVSGVIGGGFLLGVANLIKARVEAKRGPAERDKIIVEGAEKAVVSLGSALEAAERNLSQLRYELGVERHQRQISDRRFRQLIGKLDAVAEMLQQIRRECDHISPVIEIVKQAQALAGSPMQEEGAT